MPTLAANVDVWLADLDNLRQPPLGKLAPDERQRAEQLHSPALQARWVTARWALRRVLSRYLDRDPARIEICTGAHGKPRLAETPQPLRFNLSHSGPHALIAVSGEHEVGVDIERTERRRDFVRLAERGLDEDAAAAVRTAPASARADLFYAAWVRREAIAKCLGVGLATAKPNDTVVLSELGTVARCAAAVAVRGPLDQPRRFSLCDR